jgi:uncharacterized membrane protein HdeD (DUF308 family)
MPSGTVLSGHDDLRRGWIILLIAGILLLLLGGAVLSFPLLGFTLTVYIYGWSLLVGAVFHVLSLVYVRRWEGFALHLLSALLALVVGLFIVRHPLQGAEVLTLLIAILLVVGGMFRAVTAAFLQYPNWLWSILSGVIAFVLGMILWGNYPLDPLKSIWLLGLCLGIDFIVQGWAWVMFALVLRPR